MTNWYVRPSGGVYGAEDGTSYRDAWDGFTNITWGSGGVDAGDTLYVCGSHYEQLTVGASGAGDRHHITVRGDYLDDPGMIDGEGTRSFCVNMTDEEYITVRNLITKNATLGLINPRRSSHIYVIDCTFYHNYTQSVGVRFYVEDETDVDDLKVLDCKFYGRYELDGFSGPDGNGEYYTDLEYEPDDVVVNEQIFLEGTVGSLASDEWGWSAGVLYLGSDPTGLSVESFHGTNAIRIGLYGQAAYPSDTALASNIEISGNYFEGATRPILFYHANFTDAVGYDRTVATSDPSNDTNGYWYDTAGGWSDDEWNGKTFVVEDCVGTPALNETYYYIEDCDDALDRLTLTTYPDRNPVNLYSAGLRSGDTCAIKTFQKHRVCHGITVTKNYSYKTPSYFVGISCRDDSPNIVSHNTIRYAGYGSYNDEASYTHKYDTNAIQTNFATGLVIEHNDIASVGCNGSGDGDGIIIDHHVDGKTLPSHTYQSSDCVVRYNIVTGCTAAEASSGINVWSGYDNEVYYNVCYGNNVGVRNHNHRSTGNVFYNNTMYNNFYANMYMTYAQASTWKNNILHTSPFGMYLKNNSTVPTLSNNCYYNHSGCGESNCDRWQEPSGTTFAAGSGAVEANPLFKDAPNADFRLLTTSPCLDAGADVSLINDFLNSPVPRLWNPSIGAYENPYTAFEMYDYLENATPDIMDILDTRVRETGAVSMVRTIVETGYRNHVIHSGDDGSDVVLELHDSPMFYVEMGWEGLEPEDAGSVFDLYFDPRKASRRGRSFRWKHPSDGHTYVARFDMDMNRKINPVTGAHGIPNIRLKVLGRVS